jgi:hypothetical protein
MWAPLGALSPDPGPARSWLRHELSGPGYRPSLTERFWRAVQDLFERVRDASIHAGGFDPLLALLVLLVLVVLGAFVLSRLRANPSGDAEGLAVFTEQRLSAADHRAAALEALDRGDWRLVVVESTRALAAGLFERGLLAEEPGATAHEIAAGAAALFPAAGLRLGSAARTFDETLYGDRVADETRARELVALEHDLRAATPTSGRDRSPLAAVPR